MKNIMRFIPVFLILFVVGSCIVPSSKDSYLSNFERFVKDVEKNAHKFTKQDWRWSNKRYSKYSEEWYGKFEDNLNLQEKIRVTTLRTRYLVAKESSETGRHMNENLKKQLDKASDELKKYLDENLDKDIREISKGAREIGDSAVKAVDDALKELRKNKH